MRLILKLVGVSLIFPLIFIMLHLLFRSKQSVPPVVIGHRGAAGLAPENTLAALQAGIAQGADFVEVDVQRSADGVLLVFHDETVDRTTNGNGMVKDLTWAELSQLDTGSYFGPEFAGEPIPSLASVLELVGASPARLVIEVKSPHLYPDIEQQLGQVIQASDLRDQLLVISFDLEWLEKFHLLWPEITVGWLYSYPWGSLKPADNPVIDILWTSVLIDPTLVNRLHRQGYQVWVWTVDDPRLMSLLLWLGVDGITTNRPDLYNQL